MAKKNKKKAKNEPKVGYPLNSQFDRLDTWSTLVMILAVAIVPILVRAKLYTAYPPAIVEGVSAGLTADLFGYYKMVLLTVLALVAIYLLIIKLYRGRYTLNGSPLNVLLLLLVCFTLISLGFSSYKSASLLGSPERREGTLTFLSCLALFFAATQTSFSEKSTRYINGALGIAVVINFTLGIIHFLGYNLLDNALVARMLAISPIHKDFVSGTLSTTFTNPNYASGFFAAVFAYFVTFAVLSTTRQRWAAVGYAILAFSVILFSLSSSGFFALLIAFPIIIALMLIFSKPGKSILVAGVIIIVVMSTFVFAGSKMPTLYQEARINPQQYVTEIKAYYQEKSTWTGENVVDLPPSGTAPGSGRLYIWDQTWNLVQKHPLTGYGMDTLLYYFPQNDVQKRAYLSTYAVAVDKPHNFYLGFAYGLGIPAAVSLLCLLSFILYRVTRMAVKHSQIPLLVASLAFMVVFLLQWLVNDAIIGSSVVFWVLAGIAVSISQQDTKCLENKK